MKNKILMARLASRHAPMRIGLQFFGMKNLDEQKKQKDAIIAKINAAVKAGDETAFSAAFTEFTELLQNAVMDEARGLVQASDSKILSSRGVRMLTSEETKYYQAFIDAAKSSNPQQALAETDVVMPKSIIDSVMEDMVEEHPILDEILFQNTGALTEIYVSTTSGKAIWGALTAAILGELGASFSKIDLTKN
jgi:hypothetical protein